jgi:hypothetical protein
MSRYLMLPENMGLDRVYDLASGCQPLKSKETLYLETRAKKEMTTTVF